MTYSKKFALLIGVLMFGMRAAVQTLCGMHKVPFATFIAASMAGAAAWIGVLLLLLLLVDASIAALGDIAHQAQIAFTVFAVSALLFQLAAKRIFHRSVAPRRSTNVDKR